MTSTSALSQVKQSNDGIVYMWGILAGDIEVTEISHLRRDVTEAELAEHIERFDIPPHAIMLCPFSAVDRHAVRFEWPWVPKYSAEFLTETKRRRSRQKSIEQGVLL